MTSTPTRSSDQSLSILEKTIVDDSGVRLGESIGEVMDTTDEFDIDLEPDENTIESVYNEIKVKPNKKKPKVHRPCPFCFKMQSALTRHLKIVHKNEERIIRALSLPKKEKNAAFEDMRKDGIYNFNKKEMTKEDPNYIRERCSSSSSKMVMCDKCKGVYSKSYKARHQIHCGKTSGQVMIPLIPVESLVLNKMSDTFKKLLNSMIIDNVSTMAKTDPIILEFGSRFFNWHSAKTEKLPTVMKRVRITIRLLSRLYIEFKNHVPNSIVASDMFKVGHLKSLICAIEALSDSGEEMKSGLKVQIENLIKDVTKIIQAHFIVSGNNEGANNISEFLKVFPVIAREVFHGAHYHIHQKRNKSTRKPANLPDTDVINQLNNYLKEVTSDGFIQLSLPRMVFTEVRDAACARLTVYNGRRGGEPARLFIYQWKEALEGVWIRQETRQTYKNEIETGNRITFQEGKGTRQVPVFIPPDLVAALNFLCSVEVRKESDVADTNIYVFPSTKSSENHISGWHALMNSCTKANIDGKVNGTMNRHRVSTMIGMLGLPEDEQQLAFDHFGHSGDVNRNIYQAPQAERQLATTGKYLQLIDNGNSSNSLTSEKSKYSYSFHERCEL